MKSSAKIVALVAAIFLSLGVTSSGWAQKKTWDRQGVTPGTQTEESMGETKLRYNRYLTPYLPADIRSIREPNAFNCDEQGRPDQHNVDGRCLDYVSASTNTRWRIRSETRGSARILKLKEGGQTVLHAQFDSNKRPVHLSQEASQFAQAHPLPQQALQDCTRLNVVERVKCEVNNNAAVGIGIRTK